MAPPTRISSIFRHFLASMKDWLDGNATIGRKWEGVQANEAFHLGELKSDEGGERISVGFRNLSPFPLLLCWVSDDSELHHFYKLYPQTDEPMGCSSIVTLEDHVETTYIDHAFCFVYLPEDEIERTQWNERLPESASIAAGFMPIDHKRNSGENQEGPPIFLVTICYEAEEGIVIPSQEEDMCCGTGFDSLLKRQRPTLLDTSAVQQMTTPNLDGFFLRQTIAKYDPTMHDTTDLMHAADDGNFERVRELLEEGNVNVNAKDIDGWVPLHFACSDGNLEVVKLLIENGSDVCAKDNEGWTVMHIACENDHVEVIQLLVENGADVHVKDNLGQTLLHRACRDGLLDVAKSLVENGCDCGAKDNQEWISLHHACLNGHLEVIKYLIEIGSNVHAKDDSGETPMHKACAKGRLETIIFLIESFADPHATANHGVTPLHKAIEHSSLEIVKFLIEKEADHSIHLTLRANSDSDSDNENENDRSGDELSRIQALLDNVGDNVNSDKTRYGCSPLHWACMWRHWDIAKSLIENGADLHAEDDYGMTPLHWPCYLDHLDMVQLLVNLGASVNTESKEGSSPLHLACNENHEDVVWFLVRQDPLLVLESLE